MVWETFQFGKISSACMSVCVCVRAHACVHVCICVSMCTLVHHVVGNFQVKERICSGSVLDSESCVRGKECHFPAPTPSALPVEHGD